MDGDNVQIDIDSYVKQEGKEQKITKEKEIVVLLMRFFHVYLTENTVLFPFNFPSNYFCCLIRCGGLGTTTVCLYV